MDDITTREFYERLHLNYFDVSDYGVYWYEDTTGSCKGILFHAVLDERTGEILRQATLDRITLMRRLYIRLKQKETGK